MSESKTERVEKPLSRKIQDENGAQYLKELAAHIDGIKAKRLQLLEVKIPIFEIKEPVFDPAELVAYIENLKTMRRQGLEPK